MNGKTSMKLVSMIKRQLVGQTASAGLHVVYFSLWGGWMGSMHILNLVPHSYLRCVLIYV